MTVIGASAGSSLCILVWFDKFFGASRYDTGQEPAQGRSRPSCSSTFLLVWDFLLGNLVAAVSLVHEPLHLGVGQRSVTCSARKIKVSRNLYWHETRFSRPLAQYASLRCCFQPLCGMLSNPLGDDVCTFPRHPILKGSRGTTSCLSPQDVEKYPWIEVPRRYCVVLDFESASRDSDRGEIHPPQRKPASPANTIMLVFSRNSQAHQNVETAPRRLE